MATKKKEETVVEEQENLEQILESAKVSQFNFDAPASVNFFVVSPDGFNHQITIRSHATMEDLSQLFETLATTEGWLLEAGYVPKQVGKSPITQTASLPGEPEYVPDELESPFQGTPMGEPAVMTFNAVQMKVIPQEGGKSQLQFFGNAHKQPVDDYAELYYTDTREKCCELLSQTGAWKPDHLKVPRTYTTDLEVDYVHGRTNPNTGQPYKDVKAVRRGRA